MHASHEFTRSMTVLSKVSFSYFVQFGPGFRSAVKYIIAKGNNVNFKVQQAKYVKSRDNLII